MPDVIHDPRTDWCACEPNGTDRCEYRILADAIDGNFGVQDSDEAEVALLITTIERAATLIRSLPCTCEPGFGDEPCQRCRLMGQWHGEPWQR